MMKNLSGYIKEKYFKDNLVYMGEWKQRLSTLKRKMWWALSRRKKNGMISLKRMKTGIPKEKKVEWKQNYNKI